MTSNGRPDYDAGDLVVCVDNNIVRCPHGILNMGKSVPKLHSVRRVVLVARDYDFEDCDCMNAYFENGEQGIATRFRRIDPKPPEYWTGTVDADAGEKVPA